MRLSYSSLFYGKCSRYPAQTQLRSCANRGTWFRQSTAGGKLLQEPLHRRIVRPRQYGAHGRRLPVEVPWLADSGASAPSGGGPVGRYFAEDVPCRDMIRDVNIPRVCARTPCSPFAKNTGAESSLFVKQLQHLVEVVTKE